MLIGLLTLALSSVLTTNNAHPTSNIPVNVQTTSINTSIWMQQLLPYIAHYHLINLTLPGTHDAASFTLTSALSPDPTGSPVFDALVKLAEKLGIPLQDVITPWAESQGKNLYDQAEDGMRYFDIRAAYNGTDWCSYHFELGLPIYTHLVALHSFLLSHPNEIMVIEISHLASKNLTQNNLNILRDMVINLFDSMLYPRTKSFNSTTIGEMIASNQRVVISLSDDATIANYTQLWYGSSMINSYANSDSLAQMTAYNWQQVTQFNSIPALPVSALFKLSWTLTPQVSTIVRVVISLSDDATIANYTQLWYGSSMINSYANSDSLAQMTAYNWQQVTQFNSIPALPVSALFKLSWTLTPQVSTIVDSILPHKPKSLKNLADIGNSGLEEFASTVLKKEWQLCQLLLIDFQERSVLMQVIFASILQSN
ncbi:unnamed protein product [Adineta ricciae]|uniref:Phosphatidylinositol-specific phospholipase C X domain-containing protein n=1 Tax=Adineta ricciae TaxID=249248 RepID=A0A815RKF9_ADIRI|nr:unnamed protein product [Adineta ricciae]